MFRIHVVLTRDQCVDVCSSGITNFRRQNREKLFSPFNLVVQFLTCMGVISTKIIVHENCRWSPSPLLEDLKLHVKLLTFNEVIHKTQNPKHQKPNKNL